MKDRRVAVWGAARSGIAAANLLADLGARVVLSDSRDEPEVEGLDARVELRGGGNVLAGANLLVPSPGIKPATPALREAIASGVVLMSEIELAASVAQAPIVAITGTDGKSTTTEMVGAVVRAGGRPAVVAGNIGIPLSERVRDVGPDGVVVAEVSAFQLWSCGRFRPRVAVVTNIAEDHAEYFAGDTTAYTAAKARVLADMGPGDTAVLRDDDRVVRGFATPEGVERVGFSVTSEARWALRDGWLSHHERGVMRARDLPVPGLHNVCNALAALAVGDALGLHLDRMVDGLRGFRGLPHRLELVRTLEGVRWYDDSKATNPHAAAAGLSALTVPLVVITGGYEKGLDLAPIVEALLPRATYVVAMGATGTRTLEALRGRVASSTAETMEEAVRVAAGLARRGDAVVLSPAASSFDRFRSYHHRGEVFQTAVRGL